MASGEKCLLVREERASRDGEGGGGVKTCSHLSFQHPWHFIVQSSTYWFPLCYLIYTPPYSYIYIA